MARRGITDDQRRSAFLQGTRQVIARGERPLFRLVGGDAGWSVLGLPWLAVSAFATRTEARDEARYAIARELEVAPDAFDLD